MRLAPLFLFLYFVFISSQKSRLSGTKKSKKYRPQSPRFKSDKERINEIIYKDEYELINRLKKKF